ncbi:MAG: Mur ligase family protein [Christensenellales bacterium]
MMEHPYKYIIMEASSQGICEGRLLGLKFKVVCFTNITQDHLDYHKTMDNYANAKSRIIYQLEDKGMLILNKDMNYFSQLKRLCINRVYTYSMQDKTAMIYGKILDRKIGRMQLAIDTLYKKKIVNTKLIGNFNLENLLATYTILHSLHFDDALIVELLEKYVSCKRKNESLFVK